MADVPSQRKRWRASAVGLVTVAAATAACGGSVAPKQPLTGTYLLFATYNTRDPTPQCDQLGGVKTGDPVNVTDDNDNALARGQLGPPASSTRPADQRNLTTQLSCRWPLSTGPVPKRDNYRVQVANQPPKQYTRAELVKDHWAITIEEERNITNR